MIDNLEEFKTWFDSHKESDGSICLSKHPHLVEYINNNFLNARQKNKMLRQDLGRINFGGCVNFRVAERYTAEEND